MGFYFSGAGAVYFDSKVFDHFSQIHHTIFRLTSLLYWYLAVLSGSHNFAFIALHSMQRRLGYRKFVRPPLRLSVCLSVKRVSRDKTQ